MSRATVPITVNGATVMVPEGVSVAAALLSVGIVALRHAPVDAGARGAFCLMGLCQECVCEIDGTRREACRVPVREGLHVVTG